MDLLQPNQIFAGRYKILRFLAQGGMGAVFIGEHLATEKRVAVKVLWPQVLGSADAVEKFQLEAKVAGRVASDHIVSVLDAGFDPEMKMPFLVMELLEGKNLEQLVEERGPLHPQEAVGYLRQVASGLDRAHGFRDRDGTPTPIVHRDLKPENLFLTIRDNGDPLVKILDFGIAKVVSEGTKMSQEVKGTPLYMAFEQASGGRITPQTDIWALGLIAYYLMTGRVYWRAASNPEAGITTLFGEVLALPLEPPSIRLAEMGGSGLGPGFDQWFLTCVNRDPAARFRSAGEAIRALAQAFGLPDLIGTDPSARPSALPAMSLAQGPMGGMATVHNTAGPQTLSGGPAVTASPAMGQTAGAVARTYSEEKPKRSAVPFAILGGLGVIALAGIAAFVAVRAGAGSAPPPVAPPASTTATPPTPAEPASAAAPASAPVVAPATAAVQPSSQPASPPTKAPEKAPPEKKVPDKGPAVAVPGGPKPPGPPPAKDIYGERLPKAPLPRRRAARRHARLSSRARRRSRRRGPVPRGQEADGCR